MNKAYNILKYLTVLLFVFLSNPVSHIEVYPHCTTAIEYAHRDTLRSDSYIHLVDHNSSFRKAKVKTKLRVKYREEHCYYDIVLAPETPHLFLAIGRVYTAALAAPVFTSAKYSFTLRGPPTSAV